jgi:hypothetical protein
MTSLLERKLIVVTGKGGAGKTTIAAALGLLSARRGRRALVAELGDQRRLPGLYGDSSAQRAGVETELSENLWGTTIDPNRALIEWLRAIGGRIPARVLAASNSFQYFAAAAPGARELLSIVKLRELCGRYDHVVLDAPATGHALALLGSARTFASIVRTGPLSEQARRARALLEDPSHSGYLAVALGTEMAVTETLELERGLSRTLGRSLEAVVVNGSLPRRFTREELARIATSDGRVRNTGGRATGVTPRGAPQNTQRGDIAHRAARMAIVAHERARLQSNQIARLRRGLSASGSEAPPVVLTVPFLYQAELDLAALADIAARIERRLG